jgi:hypothetical protein
MRCWRGGRRGGGSNARRRSRSTAPGLFRKNRQITYQQTITEEPPEKIKYFADVNSIKRQLLFKGIVSRDEYFLNAYK